MCPKITCVNIKVCVSILQKVQQNCSTFHFLPLPVKSKVYELVLRLWYWGRTNFPASTGVVQMWAECRFWRPIWPNYKARLDSFSTIFRHFSCANSWHKCWNFCNNSGSIYALSRFLRRAAQYPLICLCQNMWCRGNQLSLRWLQLFYQSANMFKMKNVM